MPSFILQKQTARVWKELLYFTGRTLGFHQKIKNLEPKKDSEFELESKNFT